MRNIRTTEWIRAAAAALSIASPASIAAAADAQIERGQYLVTIAGCSDCHTPGGMSGTSDLKRYLGGSDTGFSVPGLGVIVGENITPDVETGIGSWSRDQIVAALRTGKTPAGRELVGVMPWEAFSHLTDEDAQAIAAFLKSIPPVHNANFGPFASSQKSPISVSAVLPPDIYNALPASQK